MILQIELTNNCNFRCQFCPQAYHGNPETPAGNTFSRPRGQISDELFDIFLREADRHATRVVLGFFGEQMLHPRFCELMARFPKQRRYQIWIFSNWSLATPERMDALMYFDSVRISVDASSPTLFSQVRPNPGNLSLYGQVDNNLNAWLARKRRPPTTLMFTESSINRYDRGSFLSKYLPRLRPTDSVVTKRVISYGGVTDDVHMTANRCRIADEPRLTVAWDGRCTPCNLDVDIAMDVGTLSAQHGIEAIVRSDKFRQATEGIRKRRGICANCNDANNHQHTTVHKGRG